MNSMSSILSAIVLWGQHMLAGCVSLGNPGRYNDNDMSISVHMKHNSL